MPLDDLLSGIGGARNERKRELKKTAPPRKPTTDIKKLLDEAIHLAKKYGTHTKRRERPGNDRWSYDHEWHTLTADDYRFQLKNTHKHYFFMDCSYCWEKEHLDTEYANLIRGGTDIITAERCLGGESDYHCGGYSKTEPTAWDITCTERYDHEALLALNTLIVKAKEKNGLEP